MTLEIYGHYATINPLEFVVVSFRMLSSGVVATPNFDRERCECYIKFRNPSLMERDVKFAVDFVEDVAMKMVDV